jgi:Tfp pilus assembly protein PilF
MKQQVNPAIKNILPHKKIFPIGETKLFLICAVILLALILIVYSKSISGGFIWDDKSLILENSTIQGKGNLIDILKDPFGGKIRGKHSAYYRPLVSLSYLINYKVYGHNASSFHILNIILHFLVCLSVLIFARLLLKSIEAPLIISILFAIHPAHTASVAWISGRTDILCSLFIMAALSMYIKARSDISSKTWKPASFLMLFFALASKELAIIYPIAVFMVDFYLAGWSFKRVAREADKYYYLFSLIIVSAFIMLHQFITGGVGEGFSVLQKIQSFPFLLTNISRYIHIVFLPFGSKTFYFVSENTGKKDILSAIGILLLFLAVLYSFRKNKMVQLGICWFFVFLLPVIGTVPLSSNYAVAEHLTYLPLFGAAVVITELLMVLVRKIQKARVSRYVLICSVAGLSAIFSVESYGNTKQWIDDISLFSHLVKEEPSGITLNLLGNAWLEQGNLSKAEAAFRKGLAYDKDNWQLWYGLSQISIHRMELNLAKQYLQEAEKHNSTKTEIYNNLGNIYFFEKDYVSAERLYSRSLHLDPFNYEAMYNLGNTYMKTGNLPEALNYYQRFITHAPPQFDKQKEELLILLNKR